MSTATREIHLASRPTGWPEPENFRLVETTLPDPADGQVLVRNQVMSVDPYMRGRMNDVKSYVPPFQVDKPLDGGAVGEVVASAADGFAPGDLVLHNYGWRDHVLADAKALRKVEVPAGSSPSVFLGALGGVGLTAYVGLFDIAGFKQGDTVFVSGAAGAVGSLVGQFAKQRGAKRVIGSAGSPEKVAYLTEELGFDAAFNYRDGDVREQLKAAAPEGIDVYFDNVGGDHLEAAISVMNPYGRIAACGAISQYNSTEPTPAPRNLALVVGKRLTIRGFIVSDHGDRMKPMLTEVGGWLTEGKIRFNETTAHGLENAPQAFLDMMRGRNTGKMLVELS
jgi:NADPH-dependent curcumin reductase CurA